MPLAVFTTTIIVTDTRVLKTGQTRGGNDYVISQVIATKVDGTPIDQSFNLRTFDELPKNVPIKVQCKLFESQQFGNSYTVTPVDGGQQQRGGQQQGSGDRLDALERRLTHVEQFLHGRGMPSAAQPAQQQPVAQPPRPAAQPPQGPPPPPPPAPPAAAPAPAGPPQGGLPPQDDIPF